MIQFPSIPGVSVSPLREFCLLEIPYGADRCDVCLYAVEPIEFKLPESSARCEDLIERLTDLIFGQVPELMQWIEKRGETARVRQVQARLDGWQIEALVNWRSEIIARYKVILEVERGLLGSNGKAASAVSRRED